MSYKSSTMGKREQTITISILLIISIISFLPANLLTSPAITSDDWSLIVAPYAFGELKPIDLTNHRPLDSSFYYVLTSIFGLRFEYYYLLNVLIIFLSSVMVYTLTKRMFGQQTWLASLAALVYLVYPVDYTRTWVMMLYIRFWWLISLAAIWYLLDFVDSGNKWKLALALTGIIIPLGAYEGQFGVVAIAAFLIAAVSKDKPTSRRLVLIGSIIIIGIVFYLWRFHIQANITDIRYYSAGSFQFNPAVIIERYLQGFDIFLSRWAAPLKIKPGSSGVQILIWALFYITICFFITLLVFKSNTSPTTLLFKHRLPILKAQFVLFLTGGAFWVAGYFPIIGLYNPSLNGHASRVNSFAIAGAALVLTAFVAILSTALARSIPQIWPFAAAIIAPFILAGIFIQMQVNVENQATWETQREIWNGTFETIPNIQDKKGIVIIIPGYEKSHTFSIYPFSTAWEIDSGAKVLYNNQDINGYFYYKDLQDQQFEFKNNGVIPPGTERMIGYKRLIFVLYHPNDNRVELVQNLEETLSLPFSVNNYTPQENIVPEQPSTADWRWLVQ